MNAATVDAVAFDVNETLFPVDQLGSAFTEIGLDAGLVPSWFAAVLRDGFALTALGGYRPFAEVAGEVLRGLDDNVDDAALAVVAAAMRQMRPHPDVASALRLLHDTGLAVVTLTNGAAELVQGLVERAGLAGYVDLNLSVDAVRRWKPAREPYLYAAAQVGVEPHRLAMVATHPWDCAGAQAADLRAAWIQRSSTHWPAVFTAPDFSGPDLVALARMLSGSASGRA